VVTLKIALRSLLRRKVRMIMLGLLIFAGTLIIVFGETFALSARYYSKQSIVEYFTGDMVLYSSESKEKPTPFSFTTPLPVIPDVQNVLQWLDTLPQVSNKVAIAQNYGLMNVEQRGKSYDVPFIFYAVDPGDYKRTFDLVEITSGSFYGLDSSGPSSGVVLSQFQVDNYKKNYNVSLSVGDSVTLLSIGESGSVNAYPSSVVGIFEPVRYSNVFNYINFLDIVSYSRLYNFTGVDGASLPDAVNNALAMDSDDDIFGLADDMMGNIETEKLVSQELTGYSFIAVKLKNSSKISSFLKALEKTDFAIKAARWNESAGFFAYVADIIQALIYSAAFLIFLIVVFILMNTLIVNILERTGEIGTLRALGGEKSFIRAIFMWESFILNGIAALAAVCVGFVAIVLVNMGEGIILPDIIQQYLVGGGPLPLRLTIRPFLEALVIICLVSVLSTLYPVRVATRISPLKAMTEK